VSQIQLLTHAHSLEVGAEQGRYADLLRAVVVIAVDLVEYRPDVQGVVTPDVIEAVGPTVIRGRVRERHDGATGDLRIQSSSSAAVGYFEAERGS
jgi:hypothetical protein